MGSAFYHPIQSYHNERYGEQLSHVQEHPLLEGFLVLLCVFNEDAAGEYQEEDEAEEEACADLLRITAVEEPVDAEEDGTTFVQSGYGWIGKGSFSS